MASEIVVRFIGEDNLTTVADKAAASINKVSNATQGVTKNTKVWQAASGVMENQIAALGGAVGSIAMQIGSSAGPYGIAAAAVIALGAGFAMAADSASKYYDEVNNVRRGIVTLAGDVEVGEKLYKTLIDIATRTPFERDDVIKMGQSLLAAGISAEDVPGYIYAVGDAATTLGKGADEANSMARALGRMNMADKITFEQMNVLTDAGINGWEMLSKATGVPIKNLQELSSKGLLPASKNIDLIVKQINRDFGGNMAKQTGTASQAASNFADAWSEVTYEFGKLTNEGVKNFYLELGELTKALASTISWINSSLIAYNEFNRTLSRDLVSSLASAIDMMVDFQASASDTTSALLDTANQMASTSYESAVNSLSGAWQDLTGYISDANTEGNNFILEMGKLVGIDQSLINLDTYIGDVIESFSLAASNALDFSGALKSISDFAGGLLEPIKGLGEAIGSLDRYWGRFVKTWQTFVKDHPIAMQVIDSYLKSVIPGFSQLAYGVDLSLVALQRQQRAMDLNKGAYDNAANSGASFVSSLIAQGQALIPVVYGVEELNVAEEDNADKTQKATRGTNEYANALRELQQNTQQYNSLLDDLRGSYMDIADAQRSVEAAQKELQDAQDPNRVLSMNLAIQAQAIDIRDLNDSMADMKKRREEIARALAGMNEQQIRNNALNAAERRELNGLNTSLDNLRKRREAVRKALAGNQLDPQQRVEFMATEVALTDAINQSTGQRQSLLDKQNNAIKTAQEERLKLLEEDKRLQADLEKSQIRVQQAILAMTEMQNALAEAQDPKRLEAYRDAVTKAELNLSRLREEQARNKVSADELAATIGVNSESFSALAESAGLTATPLDDVDLRSGELSATLNGFDGTTALVGGLAGQMARLGINSDGAVLGIDKVGDALGGLTSAGINTSFANSLNGVGNGITSIANANALLATDYLSTPLQSIQDLVGVLDTTKATAFSTWSKALNTAVDSMGDSDKVKKLINTMVALKNATSSSSTPLPYPGLSASNPGTGDMPGKSAQNITIHLHYASPPSSKSPLKDVEDYLAAQGGRLRI